jgi:hypothetical protein
MCPAWFTKLNGGDLRESLYKEPNSGVTGV